MLLFNGNFFLKLMVYIEKYLLSNMESDLYEIIDAYHFSTIVVLAGCNAVQNVEDAAKATEKQSICLKKEQCCK